MKCINCYQELPDGAKFCPHCGAKQPVPGATHMQAPSQEQQNASEEVTEKETENQDAESIQDNSQVAAEVTTQRQTEEQPVNDYQYGSDQQNRDPYNQPGYSQNDYTQQSYDQNGYNQNNYNNYNQTGYGQSNFNQNYNQPNYNQKKPLNWVPYLVLSIISTVCCCLPFGIVAIVFSAKINSALAAGNVEEAEHAAKNAKIWIIVAFAVGIVVNIITFILGMTGMIGEYYYY